MPIPVVTIPDQGAIATRPRRQPIYDTEFDKAATAIPTKLTLFRNFTQFQVLGGNYSSKVLFRDTNIDGPGGAIPKGDYMHWYSITCAASVRLLALSGGTNANLQCFNDIVLRRIASWFTFRFGETPFVRAQLDEIPQGAGVRSVQTTAPNINVFAISQGRLRRDNRYDVSLDGYPTEITDQETFGVDLEADSGWVPTMTNETEWTVYLWGTLLKGIRG